jgi:hypothetical protein
VRTVAFYLPQYHPIPENDEWWGKGFTDWINVSSAHPLFAAHQQPRQPTDLGQYDLREERVLSAQSALARGHGIDAFCMYFYWFDGRRLLERPVEAWRTDPSLLPYCLSWANESWTRRWDGKHRDVLMPQGYDPGFAQALFADLLPHFNSPHYLRMDDCPIFLVHRADVIPDAREMAITMRACAQEAGLPGLYLVAAETTPGLRPGPINFDAVAEFPPVGANSLSTTCIRPPIGLARDFRGRLMSYNRLVKHYSSRREPQYIRHRGVVPGWDNTARRNSAATIYIGATPEKYGHWLVDARALEEAARSDRGLVFVNAWNEWAECAYLEPDSHFGSRYLEISQPGWTGDPPHQNAGVEPRGDWSYPFVRSLTLAAMGSVLSGARRVRHRLR